jgi:sulfur carrier protein ThiS
MKMKILRTEHTVTFLEGTTIDTLLHELTNIPSGAKIIESYEGEIIFREEKEEVCPN